MQDYDRSGPRHAVYRGVIALNMLTGSDEDERLSASKAPYIDGPEPTEAEIRRMTKLARGAAGTWAKLRDGSWGVRLTDAARSGEQVTVRKKSGETSVVTLGKQIWTDKSVWLFTVGTVSTSTGGGSSSRSGPYECEECGERVRPGTRCWETGMMH